MIRSKHLVPTDDPANMGPAMAECTPAERLFVRVLFDDADPGRKGAVMRAAKAAGYSDSSNANLSRSGNKLFHRPRVIAAMKEMTSLLIRSDGPAAVQAVREIVKNKTHKDRLKAARSILERIEPVEQRFSGQMNHTITDNRSSDDRGIELYVFLKRLDVPREKLVEAFGLNGLPRIEKIIAERETRATNADADRSAIIDAEFVEMPQAGDDDEDNP